MCASSSVGICGAGSTEPVKEERSCVTGWETIPRRGEELLERLSPYLDETVVFLLCWNFFTIGLL